MNDKTSPSASHREAEEFNRQVGAFIRQKRIAQNLTGVDLAKRIHVSQQQVSRYERGKNTLSLYQIDVLIRALETSWDDFKQMVLDDLRLG